MKVEDLTGEDLDYAVAVARGLIKDHKFDGCVPLRSVADFTNCGYRPSSNWGQAGAIIEEGGYLRGMVRLSSNNDATEWCAGGLSKNRTDGTPGKLFFAHHPLVAVMRCYVASKLGDEFELDLLKESEYE